MCVCLDVCIDSFIINDYYNNILLNAYIIFNYFTKSDCTS